MPSIEQDMSQKAANLSEGKQEMAELLREMQREVKQMKRIRKQSQFILFSRSNRSFWWSVGRFGIRSDRSKGHLKKAIASSRTAVGTSVASIPITQTRLSTFMNIGTKMKSEIETRTSNRLNNQTTQTSDEAEKSCGSRCVKYPKLPPSTQSGQDRLRPQIISTFRCGKNDDGTDQTIELTLIQNDRSSKPRDLYPVTGSLHATRGGKSYRPSIMRDSGATSSLISRSVAEEIGYSAHNTDNINYHERFELINGAIVQSVGTFDALLYLHTSKRWAWVQFAVVEDEDLHPRWQVLLSRDVCHDASLLMDGPAITDPCACVRDWHSRYVSKSMPLSPKPELTSMQTTTPDLAVAPAGTRNGA